MTIYRGPGGTGETLTNPEVAEVTSLTQQAFIAKTAAEAAATAASSSATAASASASAASSSAASALASKNAAEAFAIAYETGTFSPSIVGATTAGTGTYSVRVGRYTKIGNRVIANVNLTWTAHTGTGSISIGGMPFTSSSAANSGGVAYGFANNLNTGSGNKQVALSMQVNSTSVTVNTIDNGSISVLSMDTSATINFTLVYEAA